MTRAKNKYKTEDIIARHSTLDWDKLRRNYRERLAQDIANGVDNKETRAAQGKPEPKKISQASKSHPRKTASQRGANLKGRGPTHDWDQMVRLYEVGLTVKDIAEHVGCSKHTVRYALEAREVYDPERDKGGPKRRRMCGRGLHDLDVPGNAQEKPGGGRECIPCRALRR